MWNSTAARLMPLAVLAMAVGNGSRSAPAGDQEVPLVFSGGHDIGTGDFGRPVPLIAAALGVKPDEFRKAFSGVTPARGGAPSGEEARRNKQALMRVLGPLGVTNERLDEVSDHYRFQPQRGELWKTAPAKGHAVVADGKVTSLVITEPGSGYSSPPRVTIQGMEAIRIKATLHFDKEFRKNGSIGAVDLIESP